MAIIKKLNGHTPKFGKNCFLADNAAIIGDVEMGNDCSIWFGAVLRGDGQTSEIMSLSHTMPSFTGVRSKTMS